MKFGCAKLNLHYNERNTFEIQKFDETVEKCSQIRSRIRSRNMATKF